MRRAILIGPRPVPPALVRELRLGPGDFIIAVDGGLRRCRRLGLRPGLAIGDWDSLGARSPERALAGIPHLTLPREKDWSDLCYALDAAEALGAREIVCLGVTGGRPDHQLGVLLDLSEAAASSASRFRSVQAWGADGRYHFISSRMPRWTARLEPGRCVSVFALGGPAKGVSLRGFRYPLRNAPLVPSSRGLSNRVVSRVCTVAVGRGSLLVLVGPE
ncbi:MAG: thiamine diphosphokinase [Oligoflexia bacterium]|nr:thiamine diphosphokinase [Oligoflexia bacterium]